MKLEEHLVNLVHKDGIPPAQDLLHALQQVIQDVHKVNISPKLVQYTQNNVFHVHRVHIQLQLDKFVLAPADVVWGNILRKKD